MKVLFLSPQLPYPPRSGASIRNLHLIKGLALHHEVTLLCFGDEGSIDSARRQQPPAKASDLGELESICRAVEVVPRPARSGWRRIADLPRPQPDLALRLASPELAARAVALASRGAYDVVHVGGLELAEVGFGLRGAATLIFDEHNAEYVLQRRAFENECRLGGNPIGALYSLLQWRKLVRYEGSACRAAAGVMAVSAVDRDELLRIAPRARIAVVPNSVDVRQYAPREAPPDGPLTLLFTGKMDFRPNVDAVVWFCREVLPLIRATLPSARFQIVGRDPTPAVRRLGGLPGVEVVGPVPDDRPFLAGAHVYVVPMRVGGGVRLKVLQAMAAGVPIVATTLGYEGVAASPGEHLVVADHPEKFARAVGQLVSSPGAASPMLAAARRLVEERYDWRVLAKPLNDFYESVVAGVAKLG